MVCSIGNVSKTLHTYILIIVAINHRYTNLEVLNEYFILKLCNWIDHLSIHKEKEREMSSWASKHLV
jgi:hypothetical protein